MKRRIFALLLVMSLVLVWFPGSAGAAANMTSGDLDSDSPTKEEIQAKWQEVTAAGSLYVTEPSVSAPYQTGELSESFLESGITYLNYVRFVANLPQVQLDDSLNESAQYGAVLLAAVDTLTHYPSQPEDMDDAFYQAGYAATTSSNLSARWGYDPLTCLQGATQGCMDDNSSQFNLACLGHRRWLLNPTLLNVGFGYAKSSTGWSYIDTKVFDNSGAGIDYDFIAWPASGNFPTNLFGTTVPWSITLNPSEYKTPSLSSVKITLTRKSDGKTWTFDSATGSPVDRYTAYMTVENSGYGVRNCIIFHPGSSIDAYDGIYTVDVSGIFYSDGTAAELHYQVDFFDVETYGTHSHSYTGQVTAPTCTQRGYTTYTCSCGDSYVGDYVDPLGHAYEITEQVDATQTSDGYTVYTCTRCSDTYTVVIPALDTAVPMFRLYNPNSGEHFYTANGEERDILASLGWKYEGVAWYAPVSGDAVYRIYNPNSGDHHYTMSAEERDFLKSLGWKYEGIGWYSADATGVPLYRMWNPNADCGSHHYTPNVVERDWLKGLGWKYEGIGWYGLDVN